MGCLAKEEKKKIKTDLQYKLPIMSKKTPLVSIIMNCHNGEKFLEKSLKSIINQTYKNWELIFWDNNSKDNTKRIFKKFVEKRFHYYKSEKLLNLYHAKNLAVKHSKGDYICFLDVDDLWIKKKLEYQVKFLLANKDCEILYSNFFIKDVVEKPEIKYAPSNSAVIGRYILSKDIFKKLNNQKKGKGGEIHITDSIKRLIESGHKIIGHNFSGKYLDCGTMKGYIKSSMEISKL